MYHNTLGRCSSRSLEPESSYDQASSHPTSTRRIVPEHWAVGTAEEQDRSVLHHQVPHGLGEPFRRRSRGQAVQGQGRQHRSSIINNINLKRNLTLRSGSSTLSARRGEASSLEVPKMNAE